MLNKFNDLQIAKTAEKQRDFLLKIYPFLSDNNYHLECCEIRPIKRVNTTAYIKSLNLWRLDAKGEEEHIKFLNKINGQAICVYYSAFCLDYNKIIIKIDGTPYEKGKINNDNAIYTQILAMDFDNIDLNNHDNYIQKLNDIGIETITIFTGHGFQDIILLKEKVYDKNILGCFTYLLLSKGFAVDEKIIDCARVLRLPYTFNCKEFDKSSKLYTDEPEAIPVKIVNNTSKRYSLSYIFKQIESLDTVNTSYLNKYKSYNACISPITEVYTSTNTNIPYDDNNVLDGNIIEFKSIKDEYNMLDFSMLPDAIQNMLIETPSGYRNSVLMFLIPFFRNKLGFPKETIIEIMQVWANRCNPKFAINNIENEVNRIYSYQYKGTGVYTGELASKFGFIDFDVYKRDNKIRIQNEFFLSYNVLSDTAVRIFLAIKLFEKIEGIKEFSKFDIIKCANISERTFRRYIDELVTLQFLDKKVSCKVKSDNYTYYINKFYDRTKGYTELDTALVENMLYSKLRVLSNSEIKLYTYLCRMLNNNRVGYCYANQKTLAAYIGKARNSISRITDSLDSKKYIKKDTYSCDNIVHCIYTLNY